MIVDVTSLKEPEQGLNALMRALFPSQLILADGFLSGDFVYVLGNAQINKKAPLDATGAERLILRPIPKRKGQSTLQMLREFFIGTGRGDFSNVFIISDRPEFDARYIIKRSIRAILVVGAVFMALVLWLMVISTGGR